MPLSIIALFLALFGFQPAGGGHVAVPTTAMQPADSGGQVPSAPQPTDSGGQAPSSKK